uniref:Glycoside hydrolase family 5 domain-containing protein n=1 Tax=Chromera velia CCMP2878 TaxID=1169474 RepID=A0A0G4H546_9ALVE|eukprot:Cvel_832.t1-p1 / transcript=Cvel_832.t1 / gene=Cvel_832 / organism=Chromera_velia_CCMP2878 / gene_product=hypothetical protein / transcript_product=hypothetical protein / location=Cvel_scaffold26:25265-26263(-) / protein_length=333 / sequence_SO=supercontig / SO=protein_coding / is_pseudo=false
MMMWILRCAGLQLCLLALCCANSCAGVRLFEGQAHTSSRVGHSSEATGGQEEMRHMYVDRLIAILDSDAEVDGLIEFAKTHKVSNLLLYDLHRALADAHWKDRLKHLMTKGLSEGLHFTATGENTWIFSNRILPFCAEAFPASECFSALNLEFEFWVSPKVADGGYYCETYLKPQSLPCDVNGGYRYWNETLGEMRGLAGEGVKVNAYVGWFDLVTDPPVDTVGGEIVASTDNLYIHSYHSRPDVLFGYTKARLEILDAAAKAAGKTFDVDIIFSAEPNFSGPRVQSGGFEAVEEAYESGATGAGVFFGSHPNIHLGPFTYFTYSLVKTISTQ